MRQYGLNSLLYYLTEVENVPRNIITEGFYWNDREGPQKYLYTHIDEYRTYFGNWAAHNVADFDYMTRQQFNRTMFELSDYGDSQDITPFAATFSSNGTDGEWFQPEDALLPHNWAYNVIRVENRGDTQWQFAFSGQAKGSANTQGRYETEGSPTKPGAGTSGAYAFFEVRIVVESAEGFTFYSVPVTDGLNSIYEFATSSKDQWIYLVIVAVPEVFHGNEFYSYALNFSPK